MLGLADSDASCDASCVILAILPISSVIFCEAVAIYGIIMAIILAGKYNDVGSTFRGVDYYAGISIFASGFLVGFCNLFCGYVVLVNDASTRLLPACVLC
jgi:V-type H+-transporting ATPase 21kDa proteolipid subunit